VGIDVAYFSAATAASQSDETTVFEGAPTLAVEVISPTDRAKDVADKIREYLAAGVSLVWIVDPEFHTVTVHRRGVPPQMFNDRETLSGGEILPGLTIPVVEVFQP
jgi:Uma2 family endonuclease